MGMCFTTHSSVLLNSNFMLHSPYPANIVMRNMSMAFSCIVVIHLLSNLFNFVIPLKHFNQGNLLVPELFNLAIKDLNQFLFITQVLRQLNFLGP